MTVFDTVKTLIATGQKEMDKLIQENEEKTS
jgi:solute carrier family 25 phosphate transporter 23/24/25/41